MQRRRALVVGLAGFLTACAGPAPRPERPATPAGESSGRTATPPPAAATPAPTPSLALKGAGAPSPPTPPPAATATPEPTTSFDVRLWNGSAEVQLDGRTISPGRQTVPRGRHELAALVDSEVVSLAHVPDDGGTVDLFVPPPLAGLAIMVENQADARPQTGLTQADVVYEALAEGGITRFIALYLTGDAPVVGPVRSLRHYFAFLAADYGADLVHIGASPEGYAWRDAMNLGALDETYADPGVWRARKRRPPHNAYTDTAADRAFLGERGRQRNRLWGPLRFLDDAPHGAEAATRVALSFRPWPYSVAWEWDASAGRYLRYMEGDPHRDADSGEQIGVASVVIQFTDVEPIANDAKLRLDVNLVGGDGPLVVFSQGSRREGSWSKSAPRAASAWLDGDGQPLVLPPGPVWVEVLPRESPLSWS